MHFVIFEEEVLVIDDGTAGDSFEYEFVSIKPSNCLQLTTFYNVDDVGIFALLSQRLPLVYETLLQAVEHFMELTLGNVLEVFNLVNNTPNI